MPKKNYYAVRVGHVPGIYTSWPDAGRNVYGFPGNQYKGCATLQEAQQFLHAGKDQPQQKQKQQQQQQQPRPQHQSQPQQHITQHQQQHPLGVQVQPTQQQQPQLQQQQQLMEQQQHQQQEPLGAQVQPMQQQQLQRVQLEERQGLSGEQQPAGMHQHASCSASSSAPRHAGQKQKFYAVSVGRTPGVYLSWDEAELQVKGFKGCQFKSFSTAEAAEEFVLQHRQQSKQKRAEEIMLQHQQQSEQKRATPTKRKAKDTDEPEQSEGTENPAEEADVMCMQLEEQRPATQQQLEEHLQHLGDEQLQAYNLAMEGHNIFITGNAGTGKTFVLEAIMQGLKLKYGYDCVAVCAPTGIAATQIGGMTLHSLLGLALPNKKSAFLKMVYNRAVKDDSLKRLQAIVIDEISMVSGEFLMYMVHALAKSLNPDHDTDCPAGLGVQLVLCGDFAQLPPVENKLYSVPSAQGRPTENAFMNFGHTFMAPCWRELKIQHILLKKVHRQTDPVFVQTLDNVRSMRDIVGSASMLNAVCSRPLPEKDGIQTTNLYTTNDDVNQYNMARLSELDEALFTFIAHEQISVGVKDGDERKKARAYDELKRSKFWRDCLAPKSLVLKVGAQVMLIRNLDVESGLANGSRGVVVGWEREGEARGWLPHIHNGAQPEIHHILPHDKLQGGTCKCVPVVRFLNGQKLPIPPRLFSEERPGVGVAYRQQIPLKLAWAITIHKSQGMSLDYVKANLGSAFCPGQVYVALSRARTLGGLEVHGLKPADIFTDRKVLSFYEALEQGPDAVTQFLGSEDEDWKRHFASRVPSVPSPPTSPTKGQTLQSAAAVPLQFSP